MLGAEVAGSVAGFGNTGVVDGAVVCACCVVGGVTLEKRFCGAFGSVCTGGVVLWNIFSVAFASV